MPDPIRNAMFVACALCMGACDEAAGPEANAVPAAAADVVVKDGGNVAPSASALDLQAIINEIDAGGIATAADLEAKLAARDAPFDADGDGKADHLHVVERRTPDATTFEIRATADDTATEVDNAKLVATLELEAEPNDGIIEVTAAYAPSYAAVVSVDVEATTVVHRVHGVSARVEGGFEVTAEAGLFVSWAFRSGRPVFVATVFIVHEHDHHDDCWPPGHCKHGKWKAHGGLPPGQAKKHGHFGHDDHGFGGKGHKGHKGHKGKNKGH